MSRNSNSVPTGKMCSLGLVEFCTGNNPEYKHWPWLEVLARPDGKDPGPTAMHEAGVSYMLACHDCFEGVWAPTGNGE